MALVTFVCLVTAFVFSKGTRLLMPGPLASAHGAIEKCGACHTKSGEGKLTWLRGLVAGNPHDDSKACLNCHKMPETAFNAHSAPAAVLKQSTERLNKVAAITPAPQSARAQNIAFPTHDIVADGLTCATCHQEHQGANFKLSKISNEKCRSCHVVKFDSFDRLHPKFENYPFKQRTQIIYDHAGHFGKHYPELAKKDPAKHIPDTCSSCHNSRDDKRVMAVAPFDQTCAACHLDQIIGKERASGPKGIAFLSLPGLDLQTLKKKSAAIGEWPEAAEAELSPFMKVMIGRSESGRVLIATVDSLNLQDLSTASDDQIKAVTSLVWDIKRLLFALISGKASDVLGDLNIGGGAKLSAALVADLTASIPRDVLIGAQQQWLPNLGTEMANRPDTSDAEKSGWSTSITESKLAEPASTEAATGSDARKAGPSVSPQAEGSEAQPGGVAGKSDATNANTQGGKDKRSADELPPAMRAGINIAENDSQPLGAAGKTDTENIKAEGGPAAHSADAPGGGAIGARRPLPSGTSRAIESRHKDAEQESQPARATGNADSDKAKSGAGKDSQPREVEPHIEDAEKAPQPGGASGNAANAKGDDSISAIEQPQSKATDQSDDLLSPTEDELRAMKSGQAEKAAGKTESENAKSNGAASADGDSKAEGSAPSNAPADPAAPTARPQTRAVPVISIESDVDPETWAEYGGWYRQDYAIFYRPTGHKDKFIYSWLFLTGPQAPRSDKSSAASVFDFLTSKDAQGSCTKCHSVDDIQGKGRVVNFSPTSIKSKQGRFTNFIHEPHFGIMENRGCLTCHKLENVQAEKSVGAIDAANLKPNGTVTSDRASKVTATAPGDALAEPGAAATTMDAEKAGSPYLKSYEQGNPQNFVSNFGNVKKELCQTCHTSRKARQDCLTCHKYHVNDVMTPIMTTKIPTQ
ncbi:MAG: hypothetical protein ACKVP4_12195 [Hyphomicrobium sp.]